MNNLLENQGFIQANQGYFTFFLLVIAVACAVFAVLNFLTSNKLRKSMLTTKFKVVDINEKNTADDTPLYTVIISNNSVNSVSIASIGFEHDGDYFNFKNECRQQLKLIGQDLVILPRSSIKFRIRQQQLEKVAFASAKVKRLRTINVYIIGMGGENFLGAAKVITRKMRKQYKEYYAYNKPEIIKNFVATAKHKISLGVQLSLSDKIKLKMLSKRVIGELPTIISPKEKYEQPTPEDCTESTLSAPDVIDDCVVQTPQPPVVNEVYSDDATALSQAQSDELTTKTTDTDINTEAGDNTDTDNNN